MSTEMRGPFLEGCFSSSSLKADSDLKILSGTGCDENLFANHKTGFSNMICKTFRMSWRLIRTVFDRGAQSERKRLLCCDHTYFHIDKFWQCSYLHCFPGGKTRLAARQVISEIFAIHFVHLRESIHVCNKNCGLHNITKVHTCLLQNSFQIVHHLVSFFLKVLILQFAGGGINTHLARYEKGAGSVVAANPHCLVVGTYRGWCIACGNNFFLHTRNTQ